MQVMLINESALPWQRLLVISTLVTGSRQSMEWSLCFPGTLFSVLCSSARLPENLFLFLFFQCLLGFEIPSCDNWSEDIIFQRYRFKEDDPHVEET